MKLTAGYLVLSALVMVGYGVPGRAQSAENAIQHVMTDQQNAWNRGDIVAFMHGYDDSPQTTFIGKTVEHGYEMILARYRRNYGSREAMGAADVQRSRCADAGDGSRRGNGALPSDADAGRRGRGGWSFLAGVREETRRLEDHSRSHQYVEKLAGRIFCRRERGGGSGEPGELKNFYGGKGKSCKNFPFLAKRCLSVTKVSTLGRLFCCFRLGRLYYAVSN